MLPGGTGSPSWIYGSQIDLTKREGAFSQTSLSKSLPVAPQGGPQRSRRSGKGPLAASENSPSRGRPTGSKWDVNDAARAHPIWTSPIFEIRHRRYVGAWRECLQLNTAKDLFKPDGTEYTDDEIVAEFDQAFQRSSGVGHNFVLGGRPQRSGDVEYFVPGVPFTVPQQALLKNWHDIHGDIPPDLSFMAGAGDPETIQRNAERPGYASLGLIENIWRYSHVSYTILRSMGFESALGKDTQGRLEPIPVGKPRANPREGLGMTPSRPPRRPTEPSDKARAIVTDAGVVYGVLRRDELHVTCQLTSGLSRPTGESLRRLAPSGAMERKNNRSG